MYSTKLISLRISLRLLNQLDHTLKKAQKDSGHRYTRNGIIIRAVEEYLGQKVSKK